MSFCMRGTCSSGISRPRSPRAIMIPLHASRISSRRSTACGRSILAISGSPGTPGAPRPPASLARCLPPSARSSARRGRRRAERRTRRSASSFVVNADAGSATPGALMPLCSARAPPYTTTDEISPPPAFSTRSSIRPSSSSRRSPGRTMLGEPGVGCEDGGARLDEAYSAAGHDPQRVPGAQIDRVTVGQRARPDLRATEILQDGDVPAHSPGGGADALERRQVGLVRPVREVQPNDVHARRDQLVEHRVVVAGGAQRGDDLRVAHDE